MKIFTMALIFICLTGYIVYVGETYEASSAMLKYSWFAYGYLWAITSYSKSIVGGSE